MKRIVILGGGSAGVMFANRMRKLVTGDEAEIIVIEKSREHVYQPAFTLVVFGLDEPENLVRPMEMIFHKGIRLVFDEATRIDPEAHTVSTGKSGDFSYDYMPVEVDADKGVVKDYGGKEIHFDLLNFIPLHEGHSVVQDSEGLGDETGWVTCDKNLMVHTKYDTIYSIGDATNFPTSKTASGARIQAKILSEKIQALIRGLEKGIAGSVRQLEKKTPELGLRNLISVLGDPEAQKALLFLVLFAQNIYGGLTEEIKVKI